MRIAVVGLGSMGERHLRTLLTLGVQVVGVDTDPEKLDVWRAQGVETYLRLSQATDLTGVVVAVPSSAHHQLGLECLDRGLHVLMEKPLAQTPAQAQQLVEKARALGLVLAVGHIERFNPCFQTLLGHLERPQKVKALRLSPPVPRVRDVGVVFDMMVHDLDLIHALLGKEVQDLTATGFSVTSELEDLAMARLKFTDGREAQLAAGWIADAKHRILQVWDEAGCWRADLYRRELLAPDGTCIPVKDGDPLTDQMRSFLASIAGERPVVVTGEEGLTVIQTAYTILARTR